MSEKRILRLVRNLVALQPLRRRLSDGGLLLDMTRMDDRKQWLVLNVSRKVWEAGLIKVHDHVIVDSQMEPLYEFDDKIVITDARHIIAVVSASNAAASDGRDVAEVGDGTVPKPAENGSVSCAA